MKLTPLLRMRVAIIAGVILLLPSLFTGLSLDDYFFKAAVVHPDAVEGLPTSAFDLFAFIQGDPDTIRRGVERGLYPWWTYWEGYQFSFWRPVSSLTHWIDFTLFPDMPALMHAVNLLWYVLLGCVVAMLYRRFFGPGWVAGCALLLYMIDDAHGVPVAFISNRNAVIAAVFGIAALCAHDRWRRDSGRIWAAAAFLLFALGLLSGESAVAAGGYLAAYALCIDKDTLISRAASLLPYVFIAGAWRAIYVRLGYAAAGAGFYIDPLVEPWRFAQELVLRLPVLLLGQLAVPNSALWTPHVPLLAAVHVAAAVVCIIWAGHVAWPLLRRDEVSRFFCIGMCLSAVPMCATMPNDRLLLFVGVGAMGVVARFFETVSAGHGQQFFVRTPSARMLAGILIAVHLVFSPIMKAVLSLSPAVFSRPLEWAADTLGPEDISEAERVIVVRAPMDLMLLYVPYVRAARGHNARITPRLLTAGLSPLEITRIDQRSLTITFQEGALPTYIFRDPLMPMPPGSGFAYSDVRVSVLAINERGQPNRIRCDFALPLEDMRLTWVSWEGRGFVPFSPPAVGETVVLPRMKSFWWAE